MSSTSGDPIVHKVAPVMAHHSTGMTKQLKADPIRRENSAFAICDRSQSRAVGGRAVLPEIDREQCLELRSGREEAGGGKPHHETTGLLLTIRLKNRNPVNSDRF